MLVEIVEPVGFGDLETLFWSMAGRSAWYAKQRALEKTQLELLTSVLTEMTTLRGTRRDPQTARPSPVDYSPVLSQLITTFRELWQASSASAGCASFCGPVGCACAVAEQAPPPSPKRARAVRHSPSGHGEGDCAGIRIPQPG